MLPWLECRDEVRDTSLGLVQQLRQSHGCLLAAATSPELWDQCIVNHIVVSHEDFCLLAELVSQEDATLILAIILVFEDEVKAGHLLLNLLIVAPAYLIEILLLNIAVNDAFAKLSLTRWEVPLTQANGVTC